MRKSLLKVEYFPGVTTIWIFRPSFSVSRIPHPHLALLHPLITPSV